jgi:hypothetical protein
VDRTIQRYEASTGERSDGSRTKQLSYLPPRMTGSWEMPRRKEGGRNSHDRVESGKERKEKQQLIHLHELIESFGVRESMAAWQTDLISSRV